MTKKNFGLILLLLGFATTAVADDWKGQPNSSEVSLGAMAGMGIVNSTVGFTVIGTFSKKIVKNGFIPDINDSVSIELELGPVFMTGGPAWIYSAHLRWDFVKDPSWTLFAVGGAGGNMVNNGSNSVYTLTPRFGVGSFYKINEMISLRGEITHDLIALGVNFPF